MDYNSAYTEAKESERLESFGQYLMSLSPDNYFVALYQSKWVGATEKEKEEIAEEIQQNAQRIGQALGEIGEHFKAASERVVKAFSEACQMSSMGG